MSKPVKVLFYCHTGHVSGAERMLFTLLACLKEKPTDYTGVVCAPNSPEFSSVCQGQNISFRPVTPLKARYTINPWHLFVYLRSAFTLIRELRRHIRNERPDVLHANSTRAGIVTSFAAIGNKCRLIWHVHDMLPNHVISLFVQCVAAFSRRIYIVPVSRATAAAFGRGIPKWLRSRISMQVIHNGIDIKRFNQQPTDSLPFLSSINLTAGHFRIGIVGQITKRKGHLEVIRALAPVFKTVLPKGRLLVIGSAMFNNDKAYLELLKSESHRLGVEEHVLFLGNRDASQAMKSLNALVMNSSNEPFGLVVTEAMASGTPVVAAAVDGVPEIIEDGVSGLLFKWGDNDTFVSHLLRISEDSELVARLNTGARQRVETLFDQRICQEKFMTLYRQLSEDHSIPTAGMTPSRMERRA